MTSKKLGALLLSVPPATARAAPDMDEAPPAPKPEPASRRIMPAIVA